MILRVLGMCLAIVLAGCDHSAGRLPSGNAVGKLAPGFAGATAWLNVDHPITMEELRGKVVVVDFWTSCCVNCIHTLPVLAAVEHAYSGKPVVVLGVHSAKFETEKEGDRLREIVSEHSIAHPIAVDGSMKLWDSWGIEAWPTVLVLDATGHVVWKGSGEPKQDAIAKAVDGALATGSKAGLLSDKPLAGLRHEVNDSGPLSFPGKVIVLADGTVVISDTGHNRIVFAGADGAVQAVVGSGLAGFTDGSFEEASFRMPEGMAQDGSKIYVADTENHAVRVIDREARKVITVAGTGELGTGPLAGSPTNALTTRLRSPWDVVVIGGVVYVALAGSHQIAALRPASPPARGTIEAFAGDGEERRFDGAGLSASFAQPSGLASDGNAVLYVVDSESSSIREVSLATRDVHTLVGQDLFVFGDVDGPAPRVRLEHPLGVAFSGSPSGGVLWVADTYNSKIKRIDLMTGVTRSVLGGRDHAVLFEPEGLAFHDGRLYVADTKHHRIEIVPTTAETARPFELVGLTAPSTGVMLAVAHDTAPSPPEQIVLDEVPLAANGPSRVHFDWNPPAGTGINEEAPFHVTWTSSDGLASVPTPIRSKGATVEHGFDLTVTPVHGVTGGKLVGELGVVLCDVSTHLVCVPVRRTIEVPFRVATSAAEAAIVRIALPAAKP